MTSGSTWTSYGVPDVFGDQRAVNTHATGHALSSKVDKEAQGLLKYKATLYADFLHRLIIPEDEISENHSFSLAGEICTQFITNFSTNLERREKTAGPKVNTLH